MPFQDKFQFIISPVSKAWTFGSVTNPCIPMSIFSLPVVDFIVPAEIEIEPNGIIRSIIATSK